MHPELASDDDVHLIVGGLALFDDRDSGLEEFNCETSAELENISRPRTPLSLLN